MTQTFNGGSSSRFTESETLSSRLRFLAIGSMGFWLSSSLILDLVIMPSLWATGMMESSGFASAGYSIFWIFNRMELLCAAAAMSGIFALGTIYPASLFAGRKMQVAAVMLLAIAFSYTFLLTPYMSSLGLDLDIFAVTKSLSAEMNQMHSIYWVLEASKVGIIAMLLSWCDR